MMACQADQRWTIGKSSKISARMTVPAIQRPFLAVGLALLAACGRESGPGEQGSRRAIEAAVQRYVDASNQGDADALASLYADDAVLLPPDHEPVRGRAAIGEFWRQGTDEGLEVTTLTVEADGDLGYLVGRYHLPATGEEPADSGKYVMCLKRQRDGAWKLTADIWNRSGESEDEAEGRGPPSIT
jgi:uncharacterized protein (TIGR02246 family)